MLIVIVILVLFAIGLIVCYFDDVSGPIVLMFTGMVLIACLIVIACVQIPAEHDYQKKLYEKDVLEYRIDNQSSDLKGNELLYHDIVEFNNELRDVKRYANSLWINWFTNAKIATIDYIEIPGLNE